jgi:hypothetical protein
LVEIGRLCLIFRVCNTQRSHDHAGQDCRLRRPFVARNLNEFVLRAQKEGTEAAWTIDAENHYPMKVLSLLVNIENEFGKHMESGLRNLKAVAEK